MNYLRTCRPRVIALKNVLRGDSNCSSKIGKVQSRNLIELTSSRYPELKRSPYSTLGDADISFFDRLLSGRIITDSDELLAYNTDWLKTCRGSGAIVLHPRKTEEVSAILRYCNEKKLAVVPQGGNTGLVGGSVPVFDEIIVSTQLMNKVLDIDEVSGIVVCQAGCILANLESCASDHNLTIPLDLGAKGSCHIGGNLATNAGGLRLLRYGSLHGNVIGLEAVLASGEILDCLSTLRKDNTGYDMKQLFIGSEGTVGIITAASIICPQKPKAISVALVGCEDFDSILQIFRKTRSMLGEILSSFEFMDEESITVVTDTLKLPSPIGPSPFYVLVETAGSNGSHDEEKLNSLLENLLDNKLVVNGTFTTEPSKVKKIWELRERITEGLMHDGYCYKYDVSLPLNKFYKLVEDMRDRVKDRTIRTIGYGHVGDGNLHLNITSPEFDYSVLNMIEPYIYDWVSEHKGSISAEHGLGFKKRDYIYHSKSKTVVVLMKQMKNLLDPNNILNPYKVLPDM